MEVKLQEAIHPQALSQDAYDSLIAIDDQKKSLLTSLQLFFDETQVDNWQKKHHPGGLAFMKSVKAATPLFILSGDVGCGKTVLAQCIATPLGKILDKRVAVYETPSNIRGAGRVGEISNRITDAFEQVKVKAKGTNPSILIIDEADDLATDRDQNQAHHEDRAGLNVLIKQIDLISREKISLAIILITNRLKVLDPAIIRRASHIIEFVRPNDTDRKLVFKEIFKNSDLTDKDFEDLVEISKNKITPYSFSDLIQKAGKQALYYSIENDIPFGKESYVHVIKSIQPSPLIK